MKLESITLEQTLHLAKQLTPLEKIQLIEKIIPDLEAPLRGAASVVTPAAGHPLRSVYGLCADLGPAPTAEDIDEIRREILDNFPRGNV